MLEGADAQDLQVIAAPQNGELQVGPVKIGKDGTGTAEFRFDADPGRVRVVLGPDRASPEDLLGSQTLAVNVKASRWVDAKEVALNPIVIKPYYWYWWLRWCRTFTVRGKVVCTDGDPVPGAEVCAYDVDWWWWWSSTQQVDCVTTAADGTFEMKFTWCCGWWPSWWWRNRVWQIEPALVERITVAAGSDVRFGRVGNQPTMSAFEPMFAESAMSLRSLDGANVEQLDSLRSSVLQKLPANSELAALHVWPWHPWQPWWDCTPDLIFKVKQDCGQGETLIIDEGIAETRWNIPTTLDVVLVATENVCCIPDCHHDDCDAGECLVPDQVCGHPISDIGGNLGANPTPAGYLFPGNVVAGTAAYNGDLPFAGIVPVYNGPVEVLNVDYYEIEYLDGGWVPLLAGAEVDFKRRSFIPTGPPWWDWEPFPWTTISGHRVVKTRERYEADSGMTWDFPGANRWWSSINRDLLVAIDSTKFPDGTYEFRVVGWEESGGVLQNPRVLPLCGTEIDNHLVLTFDNAVNPDPAHPAAHPCGPGTVHACTTEPDTHFIAVRINGGSVDACEVVDATTGTLEIDFLAHDPDGHLATYGISANYGVNLTNDLLALPGAVLTSIGAAQVGPTYGQALGQGAIAPNWNGGLIRLTVPLDEAFPVPCCYLLRLTALKRTVVGGQSGETFGCNTGYPYRNWSEFTLGVGVC